MTITNEQREQAAALAARLERLRAHHELGLAGGLLYSTPHIRDAIFRELGAGPGDPVSTFIVRGDGLAKMTPVPEHPTEQEAAKGRLEFIGLWASVIALGIGQGLDEHDYFDSRPLFVFVRHVRNAVAHNSRFEIRHDKWSAEWKSKVITRQLHGTPLFDFVTPGDIVSMLDDVISELRSM